MPAFRKKPVVIDAVRINEPMVIASLEGEMRAQAGDWIIKGVKGELYPCNDDVFRQSYDPIGKDGVHALTAPGPKDSEENAYVIPFPDVVSGVPLDPLVTDS